ncbi:MAG: DASS family sodium-coupled anion symporter [SAR86 cluster bacterium]|jgi:sodium-dependent dicarboxylate transporter 2/3/5|nr:DASS family sodium-coupled anion symporter [SAR86 cluster bacterium]
MPAYKNKGFFIGLVAFALVLLSGMNGFLPASLLALDGSSFETTKDIIVVNSSAAWFVFGVLLLMAIWWATEAVPVAVTALLPLALFPLLNVVDFQSAADPYANKNIYLFLGGFILALGIQSSGLHKRMALKMIIAVGSSGSTLVGGFMLVAALLSMVVMNTSTTLMLLPIGLAVCGVIAKTIPDISSKQQKYFDTALMLGIAYAATIGGMSTIIGTAPNLVFVSFMEEQYGVVIDFFSWMKLGVPVAIVMLFSAWVILTKIVFPTNFNASTETKNKLKSMLIELGPLTKDEIKIAFIFSFAVIAWITSRLVRETFGIGIEDAGVAIIVSILLFMIPSSNMKNDLMQWDKTAQLPWGLLILFGGGLSLAAQVSGTGLGIWIGQGLTILKSVHPLVLVFAIATLIIFLTEMTSNVATTSTFLPVIGALAIAIGVIPVSLTIPVCLAASCAFMLPVATPPNAIVYGSGKFTIATMMKAGFALNIVGIFVVALFSYYLAPVLF